MGDINSFSFCQDKIMTTGGEGGLLTTNSKELWKRAWSFKDHGKSYDAVYRRQHGPDSGICTHRHAQGPNSCLGGLVSIEDLCVHVIKNV